MYEKISSLEKRYLTLFRISASFRVFIETMSSQPSERISLFLSCNNSTLTRAYFSCSFPSRMITFAYFPSGSRLLRIARSNRENLSPFALFSTQHGSFGSIHVVFMFFDYINSNISLLL